MKYLRLKSNGDDTYRKAFPNRNKTKPSHPDFVGDDGLKVWENVSKNDIVEELGDANINEED